MKTRHLTSRFAVGVLAAVVAFSAIAHAQPAPAPPEGPRYIKSERVNVRGGPGTGNSVLEVLLLGAEVKIYAVSGDWARISEPGKPEKWVYASLLQAKKPEPKQQPQKSAQKSAGPEKDKSRKDEPAQPSKPGQPH